MANNNNNNNNNNETAFAKDWLSLTQKEMEDEASPLRILNEKPFSYFDALARNFTGNATLFQVNLAQFPQNFVVTTGTAFKVRILHSLFSANTNANANANANANPDTAASAIVVGVFGTNKVAPFKSITAASAVLALTPLGVGTRKTQNLFSPPSNSL
jgi:hypothetical protein